MGETAPTADAIVVCENCGSVYRAVHAEGDCRNCGDVLPPPRSPVDLSRTPRYVGVFAFLKPIADSMQGHLQDQNMLKEAGGPSMAERIEGPTMCGWCSSRFDARPESPNCENCGGVLPLPPGSDPGAPPSSPPRKLPQKFFFKLYVKQNFGGLLGLFLMLISVPLIFFTCFSPLIGLVGFVIAYSNFVTAYRRHIALARGTPIPGRIESVERIGQGGDTQSYSVLYRVFFRFDVGDEGLLGMKYTYDPAITQHFIGEPIWVVTLPKKPSYYEIWPPLA